MLTHTGSYPLIYLILKVVQTEHIVHCISHRLNIIVQVILRTTHHTLKLLESIIFSKIKYINKLVICNNIFLFQEIKG